MLGESKEEAVELGEVLTLSVPDTGGSGGPIKGAIRESFRFRLGTSTGGGSVKAFPRGGKILVRADVAPLGINTLEDGES